MTGIKLLLASSSPRRLTLLGDLGITPFKVYATDIDETPKRGEQPRQLAERLALEKLAAVPLQDPDVLVLAADTVVGCGRRILPKAMTNEDVMVCLRQMSGRRHHVYTGVALRGRQGKIHRRLVDSIVTFKTLTNLEMAAYAACGEGLGKAGGYAIQGRAASMIRFIAGSYSNIVGLPLFEVSQLLKGEGLNV